MDKKKGPKLRLTLTFDEDARDELDQLKFDLEAEEYVDVIWAALYFFSYVMEIEKKGWIMTVRPSRWNFFTWMRLIPFNLGKILKKKKQAEKEEEKSTPQQSLPKLTLVHSIKSEPSMPRSYKWKPGPFSKDKKEE